VSKIQKQSGFHLGEFTLWAHTIYKMRINPEPREGSQVSRRAPEGQQKGTPASKSASSGGPD